MHHTKYSNLLSLFVKTFGRVGLGFVTLFSSSPILEKKSLQSNPDNLHTIMFAHFWISLVGTALMPMKWISIICTPLLKTSAFWQFLQGRFVTVHLRLSVNGNAIVFWWLSFCTSFHLSFWPSDPSLKETYSCMLASSIVRAMLNHNWMIRFRALTSMNDLHSNWFAMATERLWRSIGLD